MGHVIRVDNGEGRSRSVLTETGEGGLLSSGYLSEKPAISYLEDDETPVFVLTNQKRGIEIARDGETERIAAGNGYRTIGVITDRRLLLLVGDSTAASVDGDQCLGVPLVDVEGVSVDGGRRDGHLTVTRANGQSLTVHSGSNGLDDVADYVTAASQAWIHVENTLDDVKRSLVSAASHRDAGEYDTALDEARKAYHGLNEPRRTANEFDGEWSGNAMIARVDQVQARCVRTLADVRLGRARRFVDDGESRWRADEYEAAHDAYDRAIEEYQTVLTYDSGSVGNRDDVHEELERVERVVERLSEAPLRNAVEADRAATDADDDADAADLWDDALEHYRDAMEVDWGADDRRFAGEPDQIRDRMAVVVQRLVAARRTAATKAKRAGDWCVGAEQYEVAIEEFETARDQYVQALEVAYDRYPDATDHLEVERDALEERLERVRAARDGEKVGPVSIAEDDGVDEPAYDVEATIGDEETIPDEPVDVGEGTVADHGTVDPESGIGRRLRRLDESAFVDVVTTVLAETGWSPTLAGVDDEYDVAATKDEPVAETLLVRVVHRPDGAPVDRETIDDCASLRREQLDADAVMVATSSTVTREGTSHARRRQVRLLDEECLSAVIESRDLTDLLVSRRVEAD